MRSNLAWGIMNKVSNLTTIFRVSLKLRWFSLGITVIFFTISLKAQSPFSSCNLESAATGPRDCIECASVVQKTQINSANILQELAHPSRTAGIDFSAKTVGFFERLRAQITTKLMQQKEVSEKLIRCSSDLANTTFCKENVASIAERIRKNWLPLRQALALGSLEGADQKHFGENSCTWYNQFPKHLYGGSSLKPLSPAERCLAQKSLINNFSGKVKYQEMIQHDCLEKKSIFPQIRDMALIRIESKDTKKTRDALNLSKKNEYHHLVEEIPLIVYIDDVKFSESKTTVNNCSQLNADLNSPNVSQISKAAAQMKNAIDEQVKALSNDTSYLKLMEYKEFVNDYLAENRDFCDTADKAYASLNKNIVSEKNEKNDTVAKKELTISAAAAFACVTGVLCGVSSGAVIAVSAYDSYVKVSEAKQREKTEFHKGLVMGNLEKTDAAQNEVYKTYGSIVESVAVGAGVGAASGIAAQLIGKTVRKVTPKIKEMMSTSSEVSSFSPAIEKIISSKYIQAVTQKFQLEAADQAVVAKMYHLLIQKSKKTPKEIEATIEDRVKLCSLRKAS
ncbi:MAG: hypothetical protein WA160_12600 [Pseudobdellovibrio sp.]